jgi:glycerophosphodiester phosphodiesterase
VDAKSPQGHTGLQLASMLGRENVVKFLLLHNAAPNLVGTDMWTPVHLACVHGHHSIAAMLVAAGGDPESQDRSGLTVVRYSSSLAAKHP